MQLKDENNSKITEGREEETTDNKELPLTVSPVWTSDQLSTINNKHRVNNYISVTREMHPRTADLGMEFVREHLMI